MEVINNLKAENDDIKPNEFVFTEQFKIKARGDSIEELSELDNQISIYFDYMRYIANEIKGDRLIDSSIYLVIPTSILKVWRVHILYTNEYRKFSQILTDNKKEFIEFYPPEKAFSELNYEELKIKFEENKNNFFNFLKDVSDFAKYEFSFRKYLINSIHFKMEKNLYENITKDLIDQITQFNKLAEIENDDTKIYDLSKNLYYNIQSVLTPQLDESLLSINYKTLNNKIMNNIENFKYPINFIENFSKSHLIDLATSRRLFNEYKKFIYINAISKGKVYVPSTNVDLVWHYHLENTDNYLEFSKKIFNRLFSHNPSDGSVKDRNLNFDAYLNTMIDIKSVFNGLDSDVWTKPHSGIRKKYFWVNLDNIIKLNESKEASLCGTPRTRISDSESLIDASCSGACNGQCNADNSCSGACNGQCNSDASCSGACNGQCNADNSCSGACNGQCSSDR